MGIAPAIGQQGGPGRRPSRAGPVMRLLNGAATWLSAVAILAMAGITAAEVIARSFFDVSFELSDELGGYLLVAAVFLGLGPAIAGGAMLRVEMVEQRLPAAIRRGLDLLFHLG